MQRPRRCINIFIWLSYLRVISCDFLIFTSKKLAKFENYNQFEAKKIQFGIFSLITSSLQLTKRYILCSQKFLYHCPLVCKCNI